MILFLDFLAKFDPRPHLVVLGVGAKSDGFGGNDSGLVVVLLGMMVSGSSFDALW